MTATNLPANWHMSTLGELARQKPNNGIFRKNPDYLADGSRGLPVVWVKELFRGNSIDTRDSRRVTPTKSDVEKYGLKKGDILFCRSSLKRDGIAFNNVYLGDDNAALFECHLIRITLDQEQVSPVFLNWMLRSPRMRAVAKSKSKTATMTTIDQQSLASIPIPLPPLAEQKRIAGILDAADALRARRREALAQLDTLLQATFLDMFGDPVTNPMGWEVVPLSEVCEAIFDCPHSTPKWTESGYVCLRTNNLGKGDWQFEERRYVSADDYSARTTRSKLMQGDVILSREGTIGVAAIVPQGAEWCLGQRLMQIRSDKMSVIPEYLLRITLHLLSPAQIGKSLIGSTAKRVNVKEVKGLPVPLPPLDLQQRFARIVESIEQQKARMRTHLEDLDTLFASLQSRAFNGEL